MGWLEAEDGIGLAPALWRHYHRFAELASDLCQEAAECINTGLPLEFPQIDVEVDLISRHHSEDR
ncbi:hypothetical protein ABT117_31180 [Streptomyces sp. NPDC002262]|uniref:hypothetical protein n=1 Tax=Streptomyces sp. NPDC002262 TaxID=3154414 RepID=UPI0033318051